LRAKDANGQILNWIGEETGPHLESGSEKKRPSLDYRPRAESSSRFLGRGVSSS
jgi:hypothetical protein